MQGMRKGVLSIIIDNKSNIILIGMPGSGKSTIGVLLAKYLSMGFVDTDLIIQEAEKKTLQTILDETDYLNLRKVEESIILSLCCRNHVIATGGSAVYSDRAMAHLKKNGISVFLKVPIEVLECRIADYETRGIAKSPEQTFNDLFSERSSLYEKHADITINCLALTHDQVADAIKINVLC